MELKAASKMVQEMMAQHGLAGWAYKLDGAARRFGQCNYRTRTIGQSAKIVLLNDEHHVRMNALHEIAHALAGPGAGHGLKWKRIAQSIGHSGARLYDPQVVKTPPMKYRASCHSCFMAYTSRKRSRVACKACCRKHNGGKFSEKYLLQWETIEGTEVQMAKKSGGPKEPKKLPVAPKKAKALESGKAPVSSIIEPLLLEGKSTRSEIVAKVKEARPDLKDPSAAISNVFRALAKADKNPHIVVVGGKVGAGAKRGIEAAQAARVQQALERRHDRIQAWADRTTVEVEHGFKRLGEFQAAWKAEPKHKRIWA